MPDSIRGQPIRFSRFHCREMLYDYMNGRLDPERKAALEVGLKEFPELKNELGAMISATHYCAELAQIKPNETLLGEFQQIRLKTEIVSEKIKYKNWPDLLRWSSEAVVISIFVAAVGWLVPWGSFQEIFKTEVSQDIVLADVDAKTKTDVVVPPLEEKAEPVKVAPEASVKPTAPTVTPTPTPTPAPTVAAKLPPTPVAEKKPGPKGFLYRIMMNVAGISDSAPTLRGQIIALGGEKAGQVEIGHRQANGNYFHFSMPESKYQELLKTLGTYGPVRIYKGPHERVMPEGIIRIILNIEDAKPKSTETEAAATSENATEATTGNATENNESTAPSSEDPAADDTSSAGE